jgi:hypothetical protein
MKKEAKFRGKEILCAQLNLKVYKTTANPAVLLDNSSF